jgi:aryl carrier-like protein
MNVECKRSILTWLRESCMQVQKEENLIQETIDTVRNLFTQ